MSNPYPPPYGSDPYQQPQSGYSQPQGGYPAPQGDYSQPQGGYPAPQGDYSQYQQSAYGQPAYGQPAYGQPVYGQPQQVLVAQPQTNNNAVISLILGICCYVGLGILTGIPAVIFGHRALRQIDGSAGTQGGKPLAIIGLVLGYMGIVGTLAVCLFFVFVIGIFGAAGAAGAGH
jgi:hypothetical protein